MTGEEGDVHYWRIFNDHMQDDDVTSVDQSQVEAECVEQFGPHPEDVAS